VFFTNSGIISYSERLSELLLKKKIKDMKEVAREQAIKTYIEELSKR